MSPVIGGSRVFWTDFIKMYESLPELWNVRSDCYKNRILKNQAYGKLIDKLKEIEPCATREIVRRKINSLRCSYRREFKKMRDNRKAESAYSTNLWYFGLLGFLGDCEGALQEQCVDPPDFVAHSKRSRITHPPPTKRLKTSFRNKNRSFPHSPCPCRITRDNEYDRLGKAWAGELQKMAIDQQIYAKRAVAEIIFKGQLGLLHMDSGTTSSRERLASGDESPLEIEKLEPEFNF